MGFGGRKEAFLLPFGGFFKVWEASSLHTALIDLDLLQKSSPHISVSRGQEVREGGRYYSAVETSRMVCTLVSHVDREKMTMVMHETRGW